LIREHNYECPVNPVIFIDLSVWKSDDPVDVCDCKIHCSIKGTIGQKCIFQSQRDSNVYLVNIFTIFSLLASLDGIPCMSAMSFSLSIFEVSTP
jgi:hypothetical protein